LITTGGPDAALTQLRYLRTVYDGSEKVGYDQQGEVFAEALIVCITTCSV